MTTAKTSSSACPTAPAPPSAPPPDPVPDLTMYRQVHAAIRASLDDLLGALIAASDGDRHRGRALRRWFDGFSRELATHHQIEDTVFFPALAERVPTYADYASTLDEDHRQLDVLLDATRAVLVRLSARPRHRGDGWAAVRAEAVALTEEFRDLMAGHLRVEDADVLPMFERHFSAAEYAALDAQALKAVTIRQAAFTVPWWMATAEAAVAADTMDKAPLAFKVVHLLTRRRYARLLRRAGLHAAASQAVSK